MKPATWALWALLDRASGWLHGHLGWLPSGVRDALVLPLVAIALFVTAERTTAWLVPRAFRWIVHPAVRVVIGTAGVASLLVQAALAGPYRAAGRRPAAVVYALGDAVVTATMIAQEVADAIVERLPLRLVRWLSLALPLLVGVAIWWWDHTYLSRNAVGPRPAGPWITIVRGLR